MVAIAAIMVTILAAIFNMVAKTNFEVLQFSNYKEISNTILVCKFEINWSTNKNLTALKHISDDGGHCSHYGDHFCTFFNTIQ
jgi:hypothetical protein